MGVVDSVTSALNPSKTDDIGSKDHGRIKREEMFGIPITYILGGGVFLSMIMSGAIFYKVFLAPQPPKLPVPSPQMMQRQPQPQQQQQTQHPMRRRVVYPPVTPNVTMQREQRPQVRNGGALSDHQENMIKNQKLMSIPVYGDSEIGNGNGHSSTGYGSNVIKMNLGTPPLIQQQQQPRPEEQDPHAKRYPQIQQSEEPDTDDDDIEDEDEEVEDVDEATPAANNNSGRGVNRTVYSQQSEVIDLPPYEEEQYYQQ